MKWILGKAFLAVGVSCLVGCMFINSEKDDSSNYSGKSQDTIIEGVDFENHATSEYLVKVGNGTSKKLVAFKGDPASDTLIGGIPASSANHGLPFSSKMFPNSQDFILFIVTYEDYQAKKDNLASLKNYPFARLYAYYNKNAKNNIVYEISSVMGGSGKIVLNNNTLYNVELRRNGIYGETIGYTGAQTILTEFRVESGDYYIFPVFRQFDSNLNEIVTYYPKYSTGNGAGKPIFETIALNEKTPSVQLDASKWAKDVTFTDGYAYIKINNQSGQAISLFEGANATPVVTSTGNQLVNSGDTLTFPLKMELKNGDSVTGQYEYEYFKSYSQFRVGNAMKSDCYLTGSDKITKNFYAGKIYTYTVTGETVYDLKVELTSESYVDKDRQKQIEAKEAEHNLN